MKRRYGRIVLSMIVVGSIFLGMNISGYIQGKTERAVSEEWLDLQYQYMEQFGTCLDSVDEIVTEYENGSISSADAVREFEELETNLMIMKVFYESREGSATVDQCFDICSRMLSAMKDKCSGKNEISQDYLNYRNELSGEFVVYLVSEMIAEG